MPDNKKIPGPEDRERINVNQPYEVRDWAKKFDVTPDRIRDSVKRVGDRVKDVKRDLGK